MTLREITLLRKFFTAPCSLNDQEIEEIAHGQLITAPTADQFSWQAQLIRTCSAHTTSESARAILKLVADAPSQSPTASAILTSIPNTTWEHVDAHTVERLVEKYTHLFFPQNVVHDAYAYDYLISKIPPDKLPSNKVSLAVQTAKAYISKSGDATAVATAKQWLAHVVRIEMQKHSQRAASPQ